MALAIPYETPGTMLLHGDRHASVDVSLVYCIWNK